MSKKLTDLSQIAQGSISIDDLIYLVDDAGGTPTSYKTPLSQMYDIFPLTGGNGASQTINGGANASGNLNLSSTSNATKGSIFLGDSTDGFEFDQSSNDFNFYVGGKKRLYLNGDFIFKSDETTAKGFQIWKYGANSGSNTPRISFYASGGTESTPTATLLNDAIANIYSLGHCGS